MLQRYQAQCRLCSPDARVRARSGVFPPWGVDASPPAFPQPLATDARRPSLFSSSHLPLFLSLCSSAAHLSSPRVLRQQQPSPPRRASSGGRASSAEEARLPRPRPPSPQGSRHLTQPHLHRTGALILAGVRACLRWPHLRSGSGRRVRTVGRRRSGARSRTRGGWRSRAPRAT